MRNGKKVGFIFENLFGVGPCQRQLVSRSSNTLPFFDAIRRSYAAWLGSSQRGRQLLYYNDNDAVMNGPVAGCTATQLSAGPIRGNIVDMVSSGEPLYFTDQPGGAVLKMVK
jgi:hypothetical protein